VISSDDRPVPAGAAAMGDYSPGTASSSSLKSSAGLLSRGSLLV